ncbi:MSHA biogenesis protein MshK [Gallaecimonas kandeliae]|uniref:MSHA biogenesis protein MshK n=1 Tax=Gallaecimonas kandeliae TaxID=3029055 RepID=UPI0026473C6D|nr:MSHA biogenesis protein MshK [Gallaecimonas kandeliae]WKE66015.1 MSHA biogenesis protein MshK [Gallaecimonas kandeliae]
MALSAPALAAELQDPTAPPQAKVAAKATPAASLKLSAVLGSKPARVIINGQVLAVGDSIQGWRLIQIKDDVVTLAQGQRRKMLTLFQGGVVTPAAKAGH